VAEEDERYRSFAGGDVIALLDTGQDLDECAAEMACEVGQLLTPLTRYRRRAARWAVDNGGFKEPDIQGLASLLERENADRSGCLFVALPDIVGSAQRTLELYEHCKGMAQGWPVAFVCQDGQETLPMPWKEITAVFIGGSTNWKCGPHAANIIKLAKIMGKHVHVGRVNSPARFEHFAELGVDSIDGTGLARYSHMRRAIAARNDQGSLYA
jgi:hypothetical protein